MRRYVPLLLLASVVTGCPKKKGDDGLREYWGKKNRVSIDGLATGMLPNGIPS